MSRDPQRVQLASGYVLHQWPYRDSSLIVEIFTREHGRMSTFARAARGPRSRFLGLAPFRALLLSWNGRGEAPQLTAAEPAGAPAPLPPQCLLSAFYLNELLLTLTLRHDAQPELFDLYAATLAALKDTDALEDALRRFEKRLLDLIGYGVDFATEAGTGRPVQPQALYRFRAGRGVAAAVPEAGGESAAAPVPAREAAPAPALVPAAAGATVSGRVLLSLAAGTPLTDEAEQRQARTLMRAALDHCLEGRELRTRTVARSLQRNAQPSRGQPS